MAKIFKSLNKVLLEKQISKLTYQIELLEVDTDLLKDKLDKRFEKAVKAEIESYRPTLLEKEIKQLSNEDYVIYHTESKLEKLEKSYDLKKRALTTSKIRKLEKTESAEEKQTIEKDSKTKLDMLNEELKAKKAELLKPYEARNLKADELKQNHKAFKEAEKAALESLEAFKKELSEKHEELINQKQAQVNQKIEAKKAKLATKKALLKPIIDRLNDQTASSIESFDDAILQVEHLTMNFGGLKAVDDLSFDVKKGEIFGLIGPNGAGKTTVFNCITQFYKPTSGKMIFKNNNHDIISLTDYKVHDVIKQGIVRTFQNVELIWELSILDNMLVGAHSLYRSNFFDHSFQTFGFKREEKILKMRAEKILTDLDLYAYKDFYPLGLPYGILKRIELARTLMTHPSLIILDEPAAGLNDSETEDLAHTIKKIQKEYDTTIFLVEHDMGLVMSICDTICAISFGKKLAIGTPLEIQNHPQVKEAYLGGE